MLASLLNDPPSDVLTMIIERQPATTVVGVTPVTFVASSDALSRARPSHVDQVIIAIVFVGTLQSHARATSLVHCLAA